eukprot:TRINITY_DN4729_c0_g1_i3.p1 TRINITY_DN4729_c0_g1~~TRINITY_DN4729_c0_g1_i3.p1  ORF type:complete len:512 (+),score=64.97 TRINITY_DN4729_c0_g1_i3:55-1590(+)
MPPISTQLCAWMFLLSLSVYFAEAAYQCLEYNGQVCQDVFTSRISVDDGTSFEILEATAKAQQQFLLPISFIDPQCYQSKLVLLCHAVFLPCQDSDVGPVPAPPCRAVCEKSNFECSAMIPQFPVLESDCSQLPIDQMPSFPFQECFNVSYNVAPLPNCPVPNMISRVKGTGPCLPSCETDYYTESQENAIDEASLIASWISFFGSLIVLTTWTIFPFKRTFPSVMIGYIAFSSLMAAIGQLMNMIDTEDIHCEDDHTPADMSMPNCLIQGILLHFFPVSIACWWLCVAFNLHQMIYFKNKNTQAFHKYYHLFSWGLPTFLVIIVLSADNYVYDQFGFNICVIESVSYSDGLFSSWFIIIGIIGVGLILHVIFTLYRSYMEMRGVTSASQNILRAQMRSFVFLVYYYGIVLTLLCLIYIARYGDEKATEDLKNFFACVFTSPDPYNPSEKCGYDEVISFGGFIFSVIVVYGQGFFLLLTFMTTEDSVACWRLLLTEGSVSYDPTSHQGRQG